jgi:hypothetical protein
LTKYKKLRFQQAACKNAKALYACKRSNGAFETLKKIPSKEILPLAGGNLVIPVDVI